MAEIYNDDDIVTINTLSGDDNRYGEDNVITIRTTGDNGALDVEQAINTTASEAESTSVVGPAIHVNDIESVAENIITNCDAFVADLRWACSMTNVVDNYSIDKVEEAVTAIDAMYKILVAFCKTTREIGHYQFYSMDNSACIAQFMRYSETMWPPKDK